MVNETSTLPDYAADISSLDTRSGAAIAFQAASMVIIMTVALGGNLLILVAIYIDKTLQIITNVFIINLACADLLLAIIGMPFTLASSITYDWIFGNTWCKVNGMANSLFCIASILTLAAVSIDRYFAIIYPLRYTTWITNKVAAGIIVYIWCHALLMACLPLTDWSKYAFIRSESICTIQWEYSIAYTLFLFSVCFFLPLGVMMFTYLRIFRTAKKASSKIVPVTGEIEGKEEPSTSEFNSCYESRTNLSLAGLPARSVLPTEELMNKSGVSLNSDIYYDRPFSGHQAAFTVFNEGNELGKQAENVNTEVYQLSKDSGLEEANDGASILLRPRKWRRTSSAYDSVDTVSVQNSSNGSLQDPVFETTYTEPLTKNHKGGVQYAPPRERDTLYVNSTFAKINKTGEHRKNGIIYLPPLQNTTRKGEIENTDTRFDVGQQPAETDSLNNNNAKSKEFTAENTDAKDVDENSPVADVNAKNEDMTENRLNQLNYLSVPRNGQPREETFQGEADGNKPLNIPVVVSRCSSTSSVTPSANGAQPNNTEYQTYGRTTSATHKLTRKKKLSTASIVSLMGPNSFRAFSKSSLALMKLRKKKDVQARAKMRRETKAAKTLLIVVGTFVLCWTPHFIGIFCFLIEGCSWPDEFFAITTWLAMLNSACNPVIYGVMSRQFRKRFKQILQCKRGFFWIPSAIYITKSEKQSLTVF